jgi:hypothetical protein
MKIEECFAKLNKKAERIPIVEHLRRYNKLSILYKGVFVKEEVSNVIRYCSLLRDSKKVVSYCKIDCPNFIPLSRMELPAKLGKPVADKRLIIVRIKKNEMISDTPVVPIFEESEKYLNFVWIVSDEGGNFGISVQDQIVEKRFLSSSDVFAYDSDLRFYMSDYDRVVIFFRVSFE